jgi:serine/threonine-protein kinase
MKIKSVWSFVLLAGIFFTLLFAGGVVFTNFFLIPVLVRKHHRLITVPEIQNLKVDSARARLRDLTLNGAAAQGQFHENIDSGLVIRQVPPPGSLVKPDRTVRFIPSLGPAKNPVPILKGISVLQAKLVLQQNNLRLGSVHTVPSNFFPANMVIKSIPEADRTVRNGSEVDLVVSAGSMSENTVVPNVLGKTMAEAEEILSLANLTVGKKTYVPAPDRLPETVLNQSPPKGSPAASHSPVDLELAGEE